MDAIKKRICNIFKLNGLMLQSDGIKYLQDLLEPIDVGEYDQWIDKIIDAIQKLPLSSSVINQDIIKKAAEAVSSLEIDDVTTLLQVIDIFQVPKWNYNIERKKFLLDTEYRSSLHGDAEDKASLFKNRYTIVYQRTINHELFRPTAPGISLDKRKHYGLVKIEYLLGLSSKESDLIVLGLLTQLVEGEFHLEDDTGVVKVNLSQAKFHTGLFTQNCFVLLEGWFDDGVLHANAIGLPPAENPDTTRALLGSTNYFGGSGTTCAKYNRKLKDIEEKNTGAMIAFLSDVWLDKIQVMDKLQAFFRGCALLPPPAIVLCGNFSSTSHGASQISDLSAAFSALGDLIVSVPELSSSKFIFVPGPNDPGPGSIYPRPPLPPYITEEFERKVRNCHFASNPCRISFCTQEIVVFREDIFTKMCRNSLYFPADSSEVPLHFARTLISEAHLSPVPLHTVPIYWGYDHCLALHPTPDLIVTCDKGDPFLSRFNESQVINPGSFMKTEYSFKMYIPSSRTIEESQVTDDI